MEYEQIKALYRLAKEFLSAEPVDLLRTLKKSVRIIHSLFPRCSLWLWVIGREREPWTCYWSHCHTVGDQSRWPDGLEGPLSNGERGGEKAADRPGIRIISEGKTKARVFIPLEHQRRALGFLEILHNKTVRIEEGEWMAFYRELSSIFSGVLLRLNRAPAEEIDLSRIRLPGMIWETEPDGRYRYVGPRSEELYGYLPEEMIGQPRQDFFEGPSETIPSDLEPPIVPRTNEMCSKYARVKRKGGKWQQIIASEMPLFDESGKWSGFRGIDHIYPEPSSTGPFPGVNQELECRVTERTQAFQRMIERYKTVQMRLEMVLWAANQGIWDWDLQTDTIYHNENYYTLLGFSKRDFPDPNKVWRQLTHPDDIDLVLKALDDHYSGSKPYYEVEYRMRKKNGEYAWILDKGRIVSYGENLVPLRMVGVHSDITERRAFEEELRQAKQAAEDANRSKSEFIANVNHELRTPLTVIMGLAETLLMEMPDNKKEFPIHILKNAKQLLLLINDIIDLSKIESGKFSLAKKSFQLAETLDYIRQSFALETEKKGISLKILGPSIVLYGDHVRLKQILTNLVANAIKFTSQGGVTLTCEISSEEESKVVLLFEVQDTGIGIGESELNKIFERFYQIDGSNHRKYSGTGLGLSIVKQLVSLMNGSVWVKSQIGEGTTFYVRIPFALPNRPLKPSTNTEREVTTE